SGDCTLRIWDLREPRSVLVLPAHDMEILSCDWNKYGGGSLIATASVDRTICMWDIRAPRPGPGRPEPLARLQGHAYAVRRVRCSPFHEPLLASASYDMTVCSWDFRAPEDALLGKLDHHTEFAVGLDWSPLLSVMSLRTTTSGGTTEALASEPETTSATAPAQAAAGPAAPAVPAAQAAQAAQQLARWRQQQGASWQSFALDLALGGALGGVSHTIVAPIERVKLLLQTQDSNAAILAGQHRRYRGFVDAVTTIVKEEGFWALWRGNGTSVMRYYPSLALNFAFKVSQREVCAVWALWRGNGTSVMRYYPSLALNFAFKDYYRVLFAPSHLLTDPSATRIAAGNFLAGAAAGATSLLVTYPLDVAHTRLATDIGTRRQFAGMRSVIAALWRAEGIRGLYRGFPASVHGIIVHRSLYFGGFDSAKQLLLKGHSGGGGGRGGVGEGGGGRGGGGAVLAGGGTKGETSGVARGEKGRAGEEDGGGNGDGLGHAPFWLRWMLAQAATTTASVVSYPFDTVRHRMMMQAGLAKPRRGEAGRAGPAGVVGVAAVEAAAGAAGRTGAGFSQTGHPSQPGQAGQPSQPDQPQGKAQQNHHQQHHHQQQQPGRKIVVFKSTWACWKHVYRQEGVLGFYKGLFSNILRGTGAAFILVMYDEVRQFVHGDKGL
ncbi:unnamed protein product, partial [Closterium sp. NIES-53]